MPIDANSERFAVVVISATLSRMFAQVGHRPQRCADALDGPDFVIEPAVTVATQRVQKMLMMPSLQHPLSPDQHAIDFAGEEFLCLGA